MSLKKDTACPQCEGQIVLHVDKFKRGKNDPLPVVIDDDWLAPLGFGYFEAYVCKHCGFTEFYAIDIEAIRESKHLGVRVIDKRSGPRGPNR